MDQNWQDKCKHCRGERARAVTAVFGGLDLGSAVGLIVCGPIIARLGWPFVFYLFAILGLVWSVFWPLLKPSQPDYSLPQNLRPQPRQAGQSLQHHAQIITHHHVASQHTIANYPPAHPGNRLQKIF